jgi:hypothetical protein
MMRVEGSVRFCRSGERRSQEIVGMDVFYFGDKGYLFCVIHHSVQEGPKPNFPHFPIDSAGLSIYLTDGVLRKII